MIDLKYATSEELSTLTKLQNLLNSEMLTIEEQNILTTLIYDANLLLKERQERERKQSERITDWERQKNNNNFKYLCKGCNGGCIPRCMNLYNKKYCSNIFVDKSCTFKANNPDYKEL